MRPPPSPTPRRCALAGIRGDQRVVESQRPEQVPFDLADELHPKFGAVAVAYRRAMRAHGLATSAARD